VGCGKNPLRALIEKLETKSQKLTDWFYADELAVAAPIAEHDDAGDFREQGIVLTQADVVARLKARSALPHQDGAAVYQFAAESFDAQPLSVGIAPVFRTSQTFFMCHIKPMPESPGLCQNLVHLHLRVVLPVTDGPLILLLALELEHQDFGAASMGGDGALHTRFA
jgi:hypothetical protein